MKTCKQCRRRMPEMAMTHGYCTTPCWNLQKIAESEKMFTSKVVNLLRWHGWLVYHPLPAQHRNGSWTTPTQGDSGWPDIAAVHPEHGFILAELKTITGRVSSKQAQWRDALIKAGVEMYIWRPSDIEAIEALAKGERLEQ